MAAIYKVTKSIFAYASYHAFIDSVGAVYDWNALFDAFPGDVSVNVFRAVWLDAAIAIWVWGEKNTNMDRSNESVCK